MILVVGSTGDLGRAIVHKLVEAGEPVRCMVRPASDRSALPDGVEHVEGDPFQAMAESLRVLRPGGFAVLLDGKQLKTPAGAPLVLAQRGLSFDLEQTTFFLGKTMLSYRNGGTDPHVVRRAFARQLSKLRWQATAMAPESPQAEESRHRLRSRDSDSASHISLYLRQRCSAGSEAQAPITTAAVDFRLWNRFNIKSLQKGLGLWPLSNSDPRRSAAK